MIVFHQLAVIANSPKESAFAKCVAPWGVVSGSTKQVQQKFNFQGEQSINNAYVFAAGKNLFITIRGAHGDSVDNAFALADAAAALGTTTPGAAVHTGYLFAYKLLRTPLASALSAAKAKARITGTANVWVTGHSSGGSLAYMVAMALATGKIPGYSVQGVISFGSPRTGNIEFQTDYNNLLRSKTLRLNNDGDYYATEAVPYADPSGNVIPAEYRSVGRAVAMCAADDGTASFVYPAGADEDLNSAACLANGAADIPPEAMTDNTGLHALGNYFDTWRRAYFTATGRVSK